MRDLLNQMPLQPPRQQESPLNGVSGMMGQAMNMFMKDGKDVKTDALIKALMGQQAPGGAGVPLGVGGPASLMPQVDTMSMPVEGAGMGMFGGGMPPIW